MAGEWIKMRLDLAEDPAVIAMAAMLDVDEDLIVGKLHRLWSWADRQSRDGHATGVTGKWIDRHIRCDGFAAAMVSVAWLKIDPAGISFPNFDRHNGETAKTRALGAKRKQKSRSDCPDPVLEMSRSDRDKSVTREEKRREEKKEDQKQEQKPSSSAKPTTPPTDLAQHKAERLAQVTSDAITAYNTTLGKPNGLLPSVSLRVGMHKRRTQVGRCLKIARDISAENNSGDTTILPAFWTGYFELISEDPFMSGRQKPGKDHENWKPDFEYLTREATMLKVYERAGGEEGQAA